MIAEWSTLVRPQELDQYPPPGATAIHGITGDEMLAEGLDLSEVLQQLNGYITTTRLGDGIPLLLAHNIRYDLGILASEYRRSGAREYPLNYLQPFCTMQSMTDICKLPGKYGKPKWPRLEGGLEVLSSTYSDWQT